MPLPVQKFREIVFQILYSQGFSTSDAEETILMLMKELKVTRRSVSQAQEKAKQIQAKMEEIDPKIQGASKEYSFDRISRVEKTVLRLGLYEMLYDSLIPPKVAIAEAIRLTRKFGTPESAHFVNAILDKIYQHGLTETEKTPPQ